MPSAAVAARPDPLVRSNRFLGDTRVYRTHTTSTNSTPGTIQNAGAKAAVKTVVTSDSPNTLTVSEWLAEAKPVVDESSWE